MFSLIIPRSNLRAIGHNVNSCVSLPSKTNYKLDQFTWNELQIQSQMNPIHNYTSYTLINKNVCANTDSFLLIQMSQEFLLNTCINIARIAKTAPHKLPGKSSLNVTFVCPVCPVSEIFVWIAKKWMAQKFRKKDYPIVSVQGSEILGMLFAVSFTTNKGTYLSNLMCAGRSVWFERIDVAINN